MLRLCVFHHTNSAKVNGTQCGTELERVSKGVTQEPSTIRLREKPTSLPLEVTTLAPGVTTFPQRAVCMKIMFSKLAGFQHAGKAEDPRPDLLIVLHRDRLELQLGCQKKEPR